MIISEWFADIFNLNSNRIYKYKLSSFILLGNNSQILIENLSAKERVKIFYNLKYPYIHYIIHNLLKLASFLVRKDLRQIERAMAILSFLAFEIVMVCFEVELANKHWIGQTWSM